MENQNIPIYKKVSGKLVKIPERNPKRRYSSVGSPEGNYILEFTDEEERQRDEEEAKWKAEQPARVAEQKRQEEEYKKFRESLIYEDRFVAYLDILGWSNAIEESLKDAEVTKKLGVNLDFINQTATMAKAQKSMGFQQDLQITQFSDTIVLSVKADDYYLSHLLFSVRTIISVFLSRDFLIRGAISRGYLIHRESIIYGPALIKAYELEQKAKKLGVPAILIDQETLSDSLQNKKLLYINGEFRTLQNGMLFLHYLPTMFYNLQPLPPEFLDSIEMLLKPVRKFISSNLENKKNREDIYKKYLWMANYFNAVLGEYPGIKLELIQVAT